MKDVAREAGYHISTVSLALRGDERISAETRQRIELAAVKLQYRVHPVVSAWVSARRAGSSVDKHLAVAYLSGSKDRASTYAENIYISAKEQARNHGFSMNRFELSDYEKNVSRLDGVLNTRNIQGIILGPKFEKWTLEGFDWSNYSVVAIGSSLVSPAVNRVVENHSLRFERIFNKLLMSGYKRIGLILSRVKENFRNQDWLKSYLYLQHMMVEPCDRIPVYEGDSEGLKDWSEQNCPEIILSDDPVEDSFLDGNYAPIYDLSGRLDFEQLPGSTIDSDLGTAAIDMLVGFITSNQRGLPTSRKTVQIERVHAEKALAEVIAINRSRRGSSPSYIECA